MSIRDDEVQATTGERCATTFAWLVEISNARGPMYLGSDYWTLDPNVAIRFLRQTDAEQAIKVLAVHPHAKAVEHGWFVPPVATASEPADVLCQYKFTNGKIGGRCDLPRSHHGNVKDHLFREAAQQPPASEGRPTYCRFCGALSDYCASLGLVSCCRRCDHSPAEPSEDASDAANEQALEKWLDSEDFDRAFDEGAEPSHRATWLKSREQSREEHAPLYAELARLKDEGERDYKGMREMQAKFIDADHERLALQRRVEELQRQLAERDACNVELERDLFECESLIRDGLAPAAQMSEPEPCRCGHEMHDHLEWRDHGKGNVGSWCSGCVGICKHVQKPSSPPATAPVECPACKHATLHRQDFFENLCEGYSGDESGARTRCMCRAEFRDSALRAIEEAHSAEATKSNRAWQQAHYYKRLRRYAREASENRTKLEAAQREVTLQHESAVRMRGEKDGIDILDSPTRVECSTEQGQRFGCLECECEGCPSECPKSQQQSRINERFTVGQAVWLSYGRRLFTHSTSRANPGRKIGSSWLPNSHSSSSASFCGPNSKVGTTQ